MFIEVEKNTTTDKYEVDTDVLIPVVEVNKEVTIDVSSYTTPVEVTPSTGKDAMTKATVTLSNIPSGGSVALYAWVAHDTMYIYTYSATPSVGDTVINSSAEQDNTEIYVSENSVSSVEENTITFANDTYTRDSTADITIG